MNGKIEKMERKDFIKVVEETLDSLPRQFRDRIRNVAVLVEDFPPSQPPAKLEHQGQRLLDLFHGLPRTKKSTFDLATGPDHIVLYQKNIATCVLESKSGIPSLLRSATNCAPSKLFKLDGKIAAWKVPSPLPSKSAFSCSDAPGEKLPAVEPPDKVAPAVCLAEPPERSGKTRQILTAKPASGSYFGYQLSID